MALVVFTAAGGALVRINPEQVAAVRSADPSFDSPHALTVISLENGEHYSVREAPDDVSRKLGMS